MDDNKRRALSSALSQIEKQFGKGAVMRMGDKVNEAIETVSTGSLGLDIALGIGGLPRGRVVEIYGPESSGKTTLTLQSSRPPARRGTAAFVDAEHALDPTMRKLGVNVDDLLVSQPTRANRRSKSPTCSCARMRSTWSSSIGCSADAEAEIEARWGFTLACKRD